MRASLTQTANVGFAAIIPGQSMAACGRQAPDAPPDTAIRETLVHAKWNASRRRKIRLRTFVAKWASDKRMVSRVYGAAFLLRARRVRGRNLRSPRITCST
jgi:hypothetical protein